MFCSKCGKEIDDSSAFCMGCGNPVQKGVDPACENLGTATPPDPDPVSEEPQKTVTFREHFCLTYRQMLSSVFAVFVYALYSIAQLIRIGQISDSMEPLYDISSWLLGGMLDAVLNFVGILFAAPGIAIAVGFWLLFWDNREKNYESVCTRGLNVIGVVYRVYQVLWGILALIGLVISTFFQEELAFYIILGFLVVGVLAFFVYQLPLWMFRTMRIAAETCEPDLQYVLASAIMYFISGGIQFVAAASEGLTLASLLVCAAPILVGCLILRYKSLTEKMYALKDAAYRKERVETVPEKKPEDSKASSAGGYKQDHIPTWKRLAMERAAAEKVESE